MVIVKRNSFVKKDNKDKKIGSVIAICSLTLIVVAILIMVSNDKGKKAIVGNHINEISYSEYKEKIKDDAYTIVLFASPDCSHCQEYKPFVNALASEYSLDIYYVNVSASDLSMAEYDEIHDSLSATKGQFDSSGEKVIPTPTTALFKNGVEISSILGDIGYSGLKEFLKKNKVIS